MSAHRLHPDPAYEDPPGAILYDQCPRCLDHAHNPRSLDRENLLRIVRVCDGGSWDHTPTGAERQAEASVYQALVLVQRLTGLPWRMLVGACAPVPS